MAESISLATIGLKSKKKRKNWPETGPSDSRRETLKSRTGLNGIYGPSGRNRGRDPIDSEGRRRGRLSSNFWWKRLCVCVYVCARLFGNAGFVLRWQSIRLPWRLNGASFSKRPAASI
jgi:hypothetical protein